MSGPHACVWIGLLGLASFPIRAAVWERDIQVEPSGQSIAALTLDSQVTSSARFNLTDLRLLNPEGQSLGHVVQPRYLTQRSCDEQAIPMERLQARATGEQGFEAIYANLDSEAIPSQAVFRIAGEDFEINVGVWTANLPAEARKASDIKLSGLKWEKRIQSEPLYDYSSMLSLRKDRVVWEPGQDQIVRIQVSGLSQSQRSTLATLSGGIGHPTQETFQIATRLMRVEAVSFTGLVCRDAVFAQATDTVALTWTAGPKPVIEPDEKRSWYRFSPGGLPLQSLIFRIAPGNLMRSIRIAGWPDSARRGLGDSAKPWTWPLLAGGQLRRIDWGNSRDSLLHIGIAMDERMRELAIGIHDRDDPPLVISGVQGVWYPKQVYFPVSQAGTYRLQFGAHGLSPVQSEFADMFHRTTLSDFFQARPEEPRLIERAEAIPAKPWISGSVLMGLGLGMGIVTLVALLYGVARKAKSLP